MNHYPPLPALPHRITKTCLLLVIGACTHVSPVLAAPASERTHLEMMIRQLNALEDTARRSEKVTTEPGQRFFFDYQRFADDIERVRHGIEGYLSPSRAQPRDPVEMSDTYTKQGRG